MIREAMYIAGAIAILMIIRAFINRTPKPQKLETFNDILDSPKYKVKGRNEL